MMTPDQKLKEQQDCHMSGEFNFCAKFYGIQQQSAAIQYQNLYIYI